MDEQTDPQTLNEKTFMAEAKNPIGNKSWDQFLDEVLAEEFIIRRSNPAIANQSKKEMIDWIAARPTPKRTPGALQFWNGDSLSVVTGDVSMDDENGKARRYQNIKVFKRGPEGNWKCVYWQVTEMPV